MNQPAHSENQTQTRRIIGMALMAAFLSAWALACAKSVGLNSSFENSHWPEGLLLLSATAVALQSVSRTLPVQNVLWGAFVIGCIGGLACAVGTLASIPFGPFVYTETAGPRLFGVVPWAMLPLWILVIYTSRGLAKQLLKPWRRNRIYGLWLMALTAVLATILDLGLDPFASRLNHYWIWGTIRLPLDWHGTPLTNFLGFAVTALVAMAFVTPMLLNKKPGGSPDEYGSSVVWILLNAFFAVAAAQHGFWLAFGFAATASLAAGVLILHRRFFAKGT